MLKEKVYRYLQDIFASYSFNRLIGNCSYTVRGEKIKRLDGKWSMGINNKFYDYFHNELMFKIIG